MSATEAFCQARAELVARPGLPGPGRRRALVTLTDDWLAQLHREAGAADVALAAVGGYGRGELAPGSDLDLVLLHDPKATNVNEIAERIWYPIWDAGLKLDHSVRTVAQARRLASDDVKVSLGLLDVRCVAGPHEFVDQIRAATLADWRALAAERLMALQQLVVDRKQRFGEVAHLVEPELKEAYGGLRDVTVLRAIAASWMTDTEHADIADASEFLLNVRDAVHLVTGRAQDRLVQQEQEEVAKFLGLVDRDELSKNVSDAGRRIAYASDLAWHRVERLARKPSRFSPRRIRRTGAERVPLAEGVVMADGEVVLAKDARPDRDPVLVLRAAAAAAQAGVMLAPATVDRLATMSAPLPRPWPREAREEFVSLLGAGESTISVWEALDQAGVIASLLPGWDVVRSAPQRDPIHRYTVDRHLVQTAVEASQETRSVARPDLLLVGALLHDFGKARGGDHTEIGVQLVSELAPQLGFPSEDTEQLVAMVRDHLLLPDVATKRDLEDPDVIHAVAERVGARDALDLLAALSFADMRATGPAAWSEWRVQLIESLVASVRSVLAGEPHVSQPRLSEAQLALTEDDGVQVLVEHHEPIFTVTVAADDRKGTLALQAGVLAMHRLQVRAAHTQSIDDRSVSVWTTQPMYGDPPSLDLIREDLRRALEGSLDLSRRLALPDDHAQRLTPLVSIVPEASRSTTVLEVRAHDSLGLLYRLGTAIAAADAVITGAKVATLGSEVVDVFFLVNADGEALSEEHAAAVRATVLGALA